MLFAGEGFGELSEDNSSSARVCASSWMTDFFPLSRSGAVLARHLARLLCQDCVFSLPEPGDYRFHAAGAQRDLAIPSSALLVSPTSSLYPDANEGIGLRATESLDCLTLQLGQTKQMWVWE